MDAMLQDFDVVSCNVSNLQPTRGAGRKQPCDFFNVHRLFERQGSLR